MKHHQIDIGNFDFTGRLDAVLVRAEEAGETVHARNIEKAVRRILRAQRPQEDIMLFLAQFIVRQEQRKPGSRAGTIMLTSWKREGFGSEARPVVCQTTRQWFPSVSAVARELGIPSKGQISNHLKGRTTHAHGHTFRYAHPHEGPGLVDES